MIDSEMVTTVAITLGGGALATLMIKEFVKRLAGKSMESVEFGARTDIIEDLRKEMQDLRGRIQDLETKVAKLQDRLVVVRTHALTAYSFVQVECAGCPKQRQLLDLIAQIVKDD